MASSRDSLLGDHDLSPHIVIDRLRMRDGRSTCRTRRSSTGRHRTGPDDELDDLDDQLGLGDRLPRRWGSDRDRGVTSWCAQQHGKCKQVHDDRTDDESHALIMTRAMPTGRMTFSCVVRTGVSSRDMRIVLALLATTSLVYADDSDVRAKKLQPSLIIVDGHLDAPMELADKWADVSTRGATSHFDLPRAKEGGLTAPFFSIFVSPMYADHGAARKALELIDLTRQVIADHPGDMTFAGSVDDIRAARKANKLGVLMGIEGGHAIEDSLGVLREMYRAGVRYMTLTHTNTNHWADSSGMYFLPDFDPKTNVVHEGLSDFGRDVIKEMNRLGMIVDISHTSDATVDDVLEVTRAPVMASHSSCRALTNMPRNLTDDQIKRIAAKGGLVMINVSSMFLDQAAWDAFVALKKKVAPELAKLKKKFAKEPGKYFGAMFGMYMKAQLPRAKLAAVVDHIEHVIKVGGIDAVGLGTDFDGIHDAPEGFEDYSKLPALIAELLRRGHSEAEVKKIAGENFLAYFGRVEATKKTLASEKPLTTVYKPIEKKGKK